jgi:hypothetical protein
LVFNVIILTMKFRDVKSNSLLICETQHVEYLIEMIGK